MNGNAVWFKPQNGDMKTKIKSSEVLLDNCSLRLIGPPRQGQCTLCLDPSTGAPAPCQAWSVPGMGWSNTSKLLVSGKKVLTASCSIKCPIQGTIKPFKPTFMTINVDNNISGINVSVSDNTHSENGKNIENNESLNNIENAKGNEQIKQEILRETESGEKTNGITQNVEYNHEGKIVEHDAGENKGRDVVKYALCDYKNCKKASGCKYLKTDCGLQETDESKNARMLKDNIGKDEFDLYAKECGNIAGTLFGKETYSIAHHHIIPANQCFKQYPEIVKLANYYEYDINNALNGICLPTMNVGYDKQPLEQRLEIAFLAMQKLGKQWHKGPHGYLKLVDEIECINKEVDDLFLDSRPFKDYKTSVNEYLEQFRIKLTNECRCREANYAEQAEQFCNTMNHICGKIAKKLRMFETDPKKSHSFFVSKIAFYYAYYDKLKDYQDVLFEKE